MMVIACRRQPRRKTILGWESGQVGIRGIVNWENTCFRCNLAQMVMVRSVTKSGQKHYFVHPHLFECPFIVRVNGNTQGMMLMEIRAIRCPKLPHSTLSALSWRRLAKSLCGYRRTEVALIPREHWPELLGIKD